MMSEPKQSLMCAGCKNNITDKRYDKCTKCDKHFHFLCVGLGGPATDSWICPDCRSIMKKGGDNSSTPVRQSENITVRKQKTSIPLETSKKGNSSLCELTDQIRLLRAEVSSMKSEFVVAVAALNRCESRLDALTNVMSAYETRLIAAENNTTEVVELRREVDVLNDKLNSQAQSMLRNEIEVSGVIEAENENVHHTMLMMSSLVGVRLTDTDIDGIHRAGPRRNPSHSPRPIVVKFTRRALRDQFLKAAKMRKLTTTDVDIKGEPSNIYVNERLTRSNRLLFRDTRKQFKEAGYKFCWTSGGIIYVKKREGKGKGSEALVIRSHADIGRILQGAESTSRIQST